MRHKLIAFSLALVALTAFAPTAGAEDAVEETIEVQDTDYICIRSRLLLGDPVCIKFRAADDQG